MHDKPLVLIRLYVFMFTATGIEFPVDQKLLALGALVGREIFQVLFRFLLLLDGNERRSRFGVSNSGRIESGGGLASVLLCRHLGNRFFELRRLFQGRLRRGGFSNRFDELFNTDLHHLDRFLGFFGDGKLARGVEQTLNFGGRIGVGREIWQLETSKLCNVLG